MEREPGFTPKEIRNQSSEQEEPASNPVGYDPSLINGEGAQGEVLYISKDSATKDYEDPRGKYAKTALLNIPSYLALTGTAIAGGVIGAAANPLSHVDTKFAVATLAASYLLWGRATYLNAREAWTLLENSEVCTSITAKALYEFSKKHTDNRKIQKAATYTGFVFWTVAEEVPWIMSALVVPELVDELSSTPMANNELSYLAGANVGAAAFNYIQARGVHEVNASIQAKENILTRTRARIGKFINRK